MQLRRYLGAATALLFIAGCAGVTPGSSVPGAGPLAAHGKTKRERAKLQLRMEIPRKHRRHGHYVSASTKSITIVESGKTLGTFDTTASAPSCAPDAGGTICRFTLPIYSGTNQVFVVNTYDQPGGVGNLLSTGTVVKTIVAGMNVIPVTLDGVVASISVAVQNPNAPAGTAATLPVIVMANDPDGNTIVGPGTYSAPITLSNTDSVATTLSTTSVTGPNTNVTLAYSGKSLTSATIGASATGVLSTNVTAATFAPTPAVAGNFVLPLGSAIGLTGPAANASLDASAIVNGPDGRLWVSLYNGSGSNGIARYSTDGSLNNVLYNPVTAGLPNDNFNGLAVGSDGNVWYAGSSDIGKISPAFVVTNIPLSGVPSICSGSPIANRIVPAADGGLWVTVNCSSSSQVLHVATTGIVVATSLPSTFKNVAGIIVATDGHVYVAGSDNGVAALLQLTVSGTSLASPLAADVATLAPALQGIVQTKDGDLWATTGNRSCNQSLLVRMHLAGGFAAGSYTSFPTPSGCEEPVYPIALADGSLWVGENGSPEALQVVPAAEGTPAMFALPLPSPYSVYAEMWDSALGGDGDLYFTNYNVGQAGYSANIVKVAY